MAAWQWSEGTDRAAIVPANKGWQVGQNVKYPATKTRNTAVLTDQDGSERFLYLYDIVFNFEVAGSYAQSHRWRNWYPRNFVQPRVQVTGQCSNQEIYGELCEWIRKTQTKSLRHGERGPGYMNTVGFSIASGGKHANHKHQSHHFRGHILNIPRNTERFIYAPEYTFEFVVVAAWEGVFSVGLKDPEAGKERMAMAMQMPLEDRPHSWEDKKTGTKISFVSDPDVLLMQQMEERKKEAKERAKREIDRLAKGTAASGVIPGVGDALTSGKLGETQEGSPLAGQPPGPSTHETGNLPGYPARDYFAPPGTPVVAPTDGKIVRLSGKDPSIGGSAGGPMGYSIYLNGNNDKAYFMTHLDNVKVSAGTSVKQGQQIAEIAKSGAGTWDNSSTHVHMGVHDGNI